MRERLRNLLENASFVPLVDLVPDVCKGRNPAVARASRMSAGLMTGQHSRV
jgi:hypothetical protein